MQYLLKVAEQYAPVRTESAFSEKGVLTPQEFLDACEMFVSKNKLWQWQGIHTFPSSTVRDILPLNKQFIMLRNIPCRERCDDPQKRNIEYTSVYVKDGETDEVNEWVMSTAVDSNSNNDIKNDINLESDDIPDIDDQETIQKEGAGADMLVEDDEFTLVEPTSNLRWYDMMITYDKYYQTPRVWLQGYDSQRNPLSPTFIFQDIASEQANKTVTMERHPHTGQMCASIHPCRHAQYMKRMMQVHHSSFRVDQYMFVFMKFISSVIPTIQYDVSASI